MNQKTSLFLWITNIIFYIANIVSICIKGANIANAVLGWSIAILLPLCIIYLLSVLNKEQNEDKKKEKKDDEE